MLELVDVHAGYGRSEFVPHRALLSHVVAAAAPDDDHAGACRERKLSFSLMQTSC